MSGPAATRPPQPLGGRPRLRLAVLVVALVAAALVFGLTDLVTVDQVQAAVEHLGPLAPVAFVPLAAVLAALLVPGPVLAAASGVLFGAALGTVVTLCSALGTAVIALRLGRAAGQDGARAVLGPRRAAATESLLTRHGLLAVAGQRLTPGVPDAPLSYSFGALGVRTWQIVGGTLIGSAPRAFAYTAIGASLDDPTSPLAIAGILAWLAAAVIGVGIARRAWLTRRRARAYSASYAEAVPSDHQPSGQPVHLFEESVVAAVLDHMNDDHRDDNLLIVRAHGYPAATAAEMTGVDGAGGTWHVVDAAGAEASIRIAWPGGPITERAEIRREVVALHEAADPAAGGPTATDG